MAVPIAATGQLHLLGNPCAQIRRQRLPLDRQHPVALQISEGAVVRDDLEPVAERLKATTGTVAAVRARADELGEQLGAFVGVERRDCPADRLLGGGA
jgi:hypothetical protein